MAKSSNYEAKTWDADGIVNYTDEEHGVWQDLINSQLKHIPKYCCEEYIDAVEHIQFATSHIPQCSELTERIYPRTQWRLLPVSALISFGKFFEMLNRREFPAAAFIRRRDEFEYLKEPDIFHELFGHAPMLTNPHIANLSHAIGKAGIEARPEDYSWLARLNWFTMEFGLLKANDDIKAYGAGLCSSISELKYSTESEEAERKPFDIIDLLRTPYRIDIHQPIYFVLDSLEQLSELAKENLLDLIRQAQKLGLHEPAYNIH